MSSLEKTELGLIAIITVGVVFFGDKLPQSISLGQLLLQASMLLFVQGLIRDVSLLMLSKNKTQNTESHKMQCLCLESSFGIVGLIIGAALLLSGFNRILTMNTFSWTVLFFCVSLFGFLIKDFVFTWNPMAIRKEKNHHNVIFSFKK